jgi:hypothetical protein
MEYFEHHEIFNPTLDWIRKSLDVLYSAIRMEFQSVGSVEYKSINLIAISNQIAMSWENKERDLMECREKLCDTCRKKNMYQCDQDIGWSPNCAFLKHHAD